MSDNRWIHDARNGNVIGPYSPADAEKLCADLCRMVAQNEFPALADLVVRVKGPFYVRPVAHRIF